MCAFFNCNKPMNLKLMSKPLQIPKRKEQHEADHG